MTLRVTFGLAVSLFAASLGYDKKPSESPFSDNKPVLTKPAGNSSWFPIASPKNPLIFTDIKNSFPKEEVKKAIKDLDSNTFAVREDAVKKLKTLTGSFSSDQLSEFLSIAFNELKNPSSLEAQRRLEKFVDSIPSKKYAEVIVNKTTNKTIIEELTKKKDRDLFIRAALLRGENIPEETVKDILDNEDGDIKRILASSGNSSKTVLYLLAQDKNFNAKLEMARNPNTPTKILSTLAKDNEHDIRWMVAGNRSLSRESLERLAKDESGTVRLWVAGVNPSTPDELFPLFARDPFEHVRAAIADKPNLPKNLLELLTKDKSWYVRIEIAKNLTTPKEFLKILSKDKESIVRSYTAENPNTPKESLETLFKDDDNRVRRSVGRNPNTPRELLEVLAKDKFAKWGVLNNPNTSKELLKVLINDFVKIDDYFLYYDIAHDRSSSPKALEVLAKYKDKNNNGIIRYLVAANPNTPEKSLIMLAQEDGLQETVAANSSIPKELLKTLIRDNNFKVRRAALENPSITNELLEPLLEEKLTNPERNRTDIFYLLLKLHL